MRKIWMPILFVFTSTFAITAHRDAIASKLNQHLFSTKAETQINGDFYWQRGNLHRAILVWKEEAQAYHKRKKIELETETLLKVARAHLGLGQFYLAIAELEKIIKLNPSDPRILALTRKRLGNAYSGISEYEKAISNYQKSLEQKQSLYTINNLVEVLIDREKYNQFIASQTRQTNYKSSNKVKYDSQAKRDRKAAIEYAKLALNLSDRTDLSSVRALINWSNLSGENLSWQQLHKGKRILSNLPHSREKVFTMLNWADVDSDHQADWLKKSLNIAKTLNDDYLKSYVFLKLGYLEEKSGNLNKAMGYSHSSQLMAQSEFAHDSLFRAQQLAGRIYQEKGNKNAAINAYKEAIASLDLLRRDSLKIDIEQRKKFNTEIEPIYRSALKLLLDKSETKKADLVEAIVISDKLRLAQLQNYFGDDCFEIIREDYSTLNNSLNQNTASISSVVLDDRVSLTFNSPTEGLLKVRLKLPKQN